MTSPTVIGIAWGMTEDLSHRFAFSLKTNIETRCNCTIAIELTDSALSEKLILGRFVRMSFDFNRKLAGQTEDPVEARGRCDRL